MNKDISKLITICMLVESMVTYINSFFVVGEPHYQMVLSLMFGIFIAVAYKIDLLKLVNIESEIPYVGSILTGIIFSRGSNYLYDLMSKIIQIN
ncbi:MAG: hypothetical protein IJI84_06195 [Clostridia bacterium]|nr:hypothetical protein [Clostridia bacterium]